MDCTIKVKYSLSGCSNFYVGKKHVAVYDDGCAELFTIFDGHDYSFSAWSPEWIKNPIYTDKETKKFWIADFHYQIVPDGESAGKITINRFGTKYYKAGEVEILAHLERPSDGRPEIIVLNDNVYELSRKKNCLYCESVKIYNERILVASIKTFIKTCAIFKEKMPLKDMIFLTLLAPYQKCD